MAGAAETIVVPILIDPKAGVAGLKAFGAAAVDTGAKLTSANTGSKLFGDGIKGLGKNLLALNPLWGIGVAAVSAFVTSLIGANGSIDQFAKKQEKIAGFQKTVADELGREVAQISKLKAAIESEVTSRKQKELALNQIRKINPEYFGDLRMEEGLINKLNIAYDNYIKNIVARAEVNVLQKQLEELSSTIIDLERQGATDNVFVPELGRDNEGRLQITKRMTEEQVKQNRLNIPYSEALRERNALLAQILLKQKGINDEEQNSGNGKKADPAKWTDLSKIKVDIEIPDEDTKVEARKFTDMFGREFNAYWKSNNPIDLSLVNVEKNYAEAKKKAAELLAMNIRIADQISGSLTPATDAFIDSLVSGGAPLRAFFEGLRSAVISLVKEMVSAIVKAAILRALTGGVGGGISRRAVFSFMGANTLGFAAGGLVTGPVSALIGEGVGTNRSNPEVVSPLNKLKDFFSSLISGNSIGINNSQMGTAGALFNIPSVVHLRADGRSLAGVLNIENLNRRRTG